MDDMDLIRLMADGECHSGVELAAEIGVSRAAVWKRLQKLENKGLPVISEKGRGYRLAYPLTLLSERLISSGTAANIEVMIKELTESTNGDALQWLKALPAGRKQSVACLAEQQSGGRGRRGKQWQSPFGANLYLSYGIRLSMGAAALEGLSLAVGVLLAKTLDKLDIDEVKVKWPNDIYIKGKKVAGILIEVDGDLTSYCNVIVGIGMNFQMRSLDDASIDQAYTALDEWVEVDRNTVAIDVISGLADIFQQIELGDALLLDEWQSYDYLMMKPVDVLLGDNVVSGQAVGVDSAGNLLVRLSDGTVKKFAGGEVSVRAQ